MPEPRGSIAFRLTLWYTAAFAGLLVVALAIVFSIVAATLKSDIDAELRQDLEELASLVEAGGTQAFRADVEKELAGPDSSRVFLRLWSATGPMDAAGFGAADAADRAAATAQFRGGEPSLRTYRPRGAEHAVRVGLARAGPSWVVELGQSLEEDDRLLAAVRNGMLIALPLVLLGAPIGWWVARRALRGVGEVTRTALEIADGALDRRVPVSARGDDLDRLASAFNTMLDRIGSLITAMREVTDNLAHDLRSPLARIRASAEHAAAGSATAAEWTAFAGTTTEECDRMLEILNSTLEIAEAQAGAAQLTLEGVDMGGLAREAHDLFLTLAEDAGVSLGVEAGAGCVVQADRGKVQRIVANLLDNGLKFTPAGGRVTLRVTSERAWVRLDVEDTGSGISATDLPRIFERFYRGDGSRSGRGSGLGLSLARAFARAHGGELTAVSALGKGSVFTLRLRRLEV